MLGDDSSHGCSQNAASWGVMAAPDLQYGPWPTTTSSQAIEAARMTYDDRVRRQLRSYSVTWIKRHLGHPASSD